MTHFPNKVGVLVPELLLPAREVDISKWAMVACDQFTSEPEYWDAARAYIGDAPSTLDLFLPEVYLGKPGEQERIAAIRANMCDYMAKNVLQKLPQGFALVKRQVASRTRWGLVMALDLEEYDYNKGSATLIRATEGTIVDRIPPRLCIREGAPLELPHILVLIDDPNRMVIEPLTAGTDALRELYDTELLDGGHISGWLVDGAVQIQQVLDALTALTDPVAFAAKYGERPPLLFAMGDGNHSFATAKANWENIKQTLPPDERTAHPARWALVEVENVHDAGIVFEPIHRVLFGVDTADIVPRLQAKLAARSDACAVVLGEIPTAGENTHVLPFVTDKQTGAFVVTAPDQQLPVGTLQNAIDALLPEIAGSEVDYIHGADVVAKLAARGNAIGFTLPAMRKDELFPTVVYDGALPRKTFSMGEANEKRYYLECREIERGK